MSTESRSKTIDITPEWRGLMRWLLNVAKDDLYDHEVEYSPSIDGVAIMGGEETTMLIFADLIWELKGGTFVKRPDLTWKQVKKDAFCYAEVGYDVWVAGHREKAIPASPAWE